MHEHIYGYIPGYMYTIYMYVSLEELKESLYSYFLLNHSTLIFQALDTFNTAVVSPIYYVMFTTLAIIASVIMFKVLFPQKKKVC